VHDARVVDVVEVLEVVEVVVVSAHAGPAANITVAAASRPAVVAASRDPNMGGTSEAFEPVGRGAAFRGQNAALQRPVTLSSRISATFSFGLPVPTRKGDRPAPGKRVVPRKFT